MRTTRRGGRYRGARLGHAAIIAAALATMIAALASDGDLQRALLESGCVNPQIETVLQQRDLVAYRANCLGSSHKKLVIVCSKGRCSPSTPSRDPDR